MRIFKQNLIREWSVLKAIPPILYGALAASLIVAIGYWLLGFPSQKLYGVFLITFFLFYALGLPMLFVLALRGSVSWSQCMVLGVLVSPLAMIAVVGNPSGFEFLSVVCLSGGIGGSVSGFAYSRFNKNIQAARSEAPRRWI